MGAREIRPWQMASIVRQMLSEATCAFICQYPDRARGLLARDVAVSDYGREAGAGV